MPFTSLGFVSDDTLEHARSVAAIIWPDVAGLTFNGRSGRSEWFNVQTPAGVYSLSFDADGYWRATNHAGQPVTVPTENVRRTNY